MSRGGKRPGQGRKKGPEKRTVTIKHDKKVIDQVREKLNGHELQKSGQEWLDEIANS